VTLIAAFAVNKVPIIIGDVLVSATRPTDKSIPLPGSGQPSHNFAGDFQAVGLTQKVNVISDNLIVAWAGPKIVASTFVRELKRAMLSISSPSWEYVNRVIEKLKKEELSIRLAKNFSFVLLYRDHKHVLIDGHNMRMEKVEGFESLLVAGSGSEAFIHLLKSVGGSSNGEMPEWVKTAHTVISLTTNLWSLDITSQINIYHGFGGGYEIGTRIGDGLGKVGDILLAAVEVDATGWVRVNPRLTKLDYLDDHLVIRVLDLQGPARRADEGLDSTVTFQEKQTTRGFIISPVDKQLVKIEELELERLPDWNAMHTGVLLTGKAQNGKYLSRTFQYTSPQRNSPIRIEHQEGYGKVTWAPELTGVLVRCAKEFLSSNSASNDGV